MRILVDADACPVKDIIIKVAKKYDVEVYMYFDTSHVYSDDYSKVFIVDKSNDSVDLYILKELKKSDIVVTQDYGLASLVIVKNGYAINQNGLIYTNDNIDKLLFERFISKKNRMAKVKMKNQRKRQDKDDEIFEKKLVNLICKTI